MLESTATLAALAALTSRIRLGILVASATYRHPAVYAKSMAAVDRISDGRVIVGLGAGWQLNEHASYGIELGSITERIDRFDEYVTVVRSMLEHERTTFSGRYFTLTDAPCDPRPVQGPVPLLLGVRGKTRTMRIAARAATVWNAWATPTTLRELNSVLDRHCAAEGRDPRSVARSANAGLFLSHDEAWLRDHRNQDDRHPTIVGTPNEVVEIVAAYRAAGCDELILPFETEGNPQYLEMLAMFHDEVAIHFNA
jgi:alkanesulfonate monooxygenase SsuD/methylene tetrahydromethanopterin reductase-like flavin-dependent oxidoreductase (luciferase family)